MGITSTIYTVPIAGSVSNWASFSGNPSDPIIVVGPLQLAIKCSKENEVAAAAEESLPHAAMVNVSTQIQILEYLPDSGQARVRVTTEDYLHGLIVTELTKTPAAICAGFGLTNLIRTASDPVIEVSLLID